ncbi:MAG: hypothetical protein Q4D02_08485 [Clostridia bacterium]|nr:hypothetical protein [Clostridia bacterium]
MNKTELLNLLNELNFPKDEYYVLSGASLVLRGIREKAGDLDLCISNELFENIKEKYNLTEDKKNDCGFYRISDSLEVVVNKKENFKMEMKNDYNLEDLNVILDFKLKRNAPKDQKDIENIKNYLKINN